MPKIAYSKEERQRLREDLITYALELFAKQGITHTSVEQIYQHVGISRTFFYTFFPTKEDLIMQAFFHQQPKIIKYAQHLINDPTMSWKESISKFLYDLCFMNDSCFVIMTIEEQQSLYNHISKENYQLLQERQLQFFMRLSQVFNINTNEAQAKLIGNLLLSLAVIQKAIPESLPFLFQDAAKELAEVHISNLVDYIENLY